MSASPCAPSERYVAEDSPEVLGEFFMALGVPEFTGSNNDPEFASEAVKE